MALRITKSQLEKSIEVHIADIVQDENARGKIKEKIINTCEEFSIENEQNWSGLPD